MPFHGNRGVGGRAASVDLSPEPAPGTQPAASSSAAKAPQQVTVATPMHSGSAERRNVADAAAARLLETAKKYKDVTGHGMEWTGGGDSRVNQRRDAISVLLAARDPSAFTSTLDKLGANVAEDINFVRQAELTDNTVTGADQFTWSKNENQLSNASGMQAEFEKRVAAGRTVAAELAAGLREFMPAVHGSVVGLAFMDDVELRARSLVDILLQFRGRDQTGGARVAQVGPPAIAEQRVVLASAKLHGADAASARELGLLRLAVLSHPFSSMNGVFLARNAVAGLAKAVNGNADAWRGWVYGEAPAGCKTSMYESIHHNYSTETPRVIEAGIGQFFFTKGPAAERPRVFSQLVGALSAAEAGDAQRARRAVTELRSSDVALKTELRGKVEGASDGELAGVIIDALKAATSTAKRIANPREAFLCAAEVYRAVCQDRPNAEKLTAALFRAGAATDEVAAVIARLESGDGLGLLQDLGKARLAIRAAIVNATAGYERHQLIKFDGMLDRLALETLGGSVERVGDLRTDAQKSEALLGVQTALRCIVASSLHEIRDSADPKAREGRALETILEDVDALLPEAGAAKSVDAAEYRGLMAEVDVAVRRIVQNIRAFVQVREADVAAGGAALDPEFLDQLVKQSPMHYAAALAQKGMRVGLEERVTPREVANVEGMRVLNSVGPVVFENVIFAENTKELIDLHPSKDAMAVLYQLQEKKMVAVGGLLADVTNAPGGNSHLNMYAMNNGITVLALPELRTKYADFFAKVKTEGGLYVDDTGGELRMMTVGLAKERGLLTDAKVAELRPGTNKRIKYLKPEGDSFTVFAQHDAIISPDRPLKEIELYVPVETVKGLGKEALSFAELAALGTQARHLAGEKGTVLALLGAHATLGKYVPSGSAVSPTRVRMMLEDAGILKDWEAPWQHDPKVGVVDDNNFHQSAFYTDATYRAGVRARLQKLTKARLEEAFITTDATTGEKRLTAVGEKLYAELDRNPALHNHGSWIARSSFTGEDRPNKSGAGQYESFPGLTTKAERIEGIIGVIESTWMAEPIENNVADQVNLQHIMPSVTVQCCLDKPLASGVMISRDIEQGTRGCVTYQLVKGFGGGVEGGKTEEGLITATGSQKKIEYPGEPDGLVPEAAMRELRKIVLEVEKYFNEKIEPGKGHAVDMEVAYVDGKWNIVQGRVIIVDK